MALLFLARFLRQDVQLAIELHRFLEDDVVLRQAVLNEFRQRLVPLDEEHLGDLLLDLSAHFVAHRRPVLAEELVDLGIGGWQSVYLRQDVTQDLQQSGMELGVISRGALLLRLGQFIYQREQAILRGHENVWRHGLCELEGLVSNDLAQELAAQECLSRGRVALDRSEALQKK